MTAVSAVPAVACSSAAFNACSCAGIRLGTIRNTAVTSYCLWLAGCVQLASAGVDLEAPLPSLTPAQSFGVAVVNSSVAGPLASGVLQSHVVQSVPWTPETFPNPNKDPLACGLKTVGLICDPDLLLKTSTRNAIQDQLERLQKKLKCVIAVAVCRDVESLGTWPWRNWGTRVDHLASALLRQWSVMEGTRAPGVILAVALYRDLVSIEVSRKNPKCNGLNYLTRSIADYGVLPYVDNGQLDKGLVSGIAEIAVALSEPGDSVTPLSATKPFVVLCALAVSLAILMFACGCCSSVEVAPNTPQETIGS